MRMTEFAAVGRGEVHVWTLTESALAAAAPHPAPPAPNQAARIRQRMNGGEWPRRWRVTAFELPGRADLQALGTAFEQFTRRHDTLLSFFSAEGGTIRRHCVPPEAVALERSLLGVFATEEETTARLTDLFDVATDPLGRPAYRYAAVVGQDATTVLVAADHLHTDPHSHALAAYEVHELYVAARSGRRHRLPPPGSHLRHCRSRADGIDEATRVWSRFAARAGGGLPPFPLDLGLPPGCRRSLVHREFELLDDAAAGAFEQWSRRHGGTLFSGLLAAAGAAARELKGLDVLRVILPVQTRDDPGKPTVGWFASAGPAEFRTTSLSRLADAVPAARAATLTAKRVATVPMELATGALPGGDRAWWLSYIDFRGLPGAEHAEEWNSRLLAGPRTGAGADLWICRTHRGVYVHTRYPATDSAERNVTDFVETIAKTVSAYAG